MLYYNELRELKEACEALLDDVNERYPDKEPYVWKCPHMQRINDLIEYEIRKRYGNKISSESD